MTALARRRQAFSLTNVILGLLTLVGVGLLIYRFVVGLGPTTNLSDEYPWGLWITLDLFLIPVGGAAFTTSLIGHFFRDKRYHRVVRPAVLTGFLCYSLVGIILLADLGRWHQFYNFLLPPNMNVHSFLWEIAMAVTFYTLVLVVELAPTILERFNLKSPARALESSMLVIAGAGVVISSLHQSSIGHLFLLVPYKLHEIWWTPLLGLLYLIQSIFAGLAMAVVAIIVTKRWLRLKADKVLMVKIGRLIGIVVSLYTAIQIVGWITEGDIPALFTSGGYSLVIWAELILGVAIPLGILFSKLGRRTDGVLWASVFVIIGAFISRLATSWVGLDRPVWASYAPHWMEVLITIGLFAGAGLVYSLVARNFPMFPEDH
jgi:Ni/Fe-hydrogenase subunit HybB-like protein